MSRIISASRMAETGPSEGTAIPEAGPWLLDGLRRSAGGRSSLWPRVGSWRQLLHFLGQRALRDGKSLFPLTS